MTIVSCIRSAAVAGPQTDAFLTRPARRELARRSYGDLLSDIVETAAGLRLLNVSHGTHVGIVSDNRPEWMQCDLAVIGLGAVDVPMGADITGAEIGILLNHAGCPIIICETWEIAARILAVNSQETALSEIVVIESEPEPTAGDTDEGIRDAEQETEHDFERASRTARSQHVGIHSLSQLLARAEAEETTPRNELEEHLAAGNEDDPVTILYTSGTTGVAKGVVLTHRSFLFQIERVPRRLPVERGHVFMSALPIWQSFERAAEYIVLACGGTIAYSKPMLRALFSDLRAYAPHYATGVPRLWEGLQRSYQTELVGRSHRMWTLFADKWARARDRVLGNRPVWSRNPDTLYRLMLVPFAILVCIPGLIGRYISYRKLRSRFGPRFVAGISGGGAIPAHTGRFYRSAGITLLEGYGLTETGPILAVGDYFHQVTGTVGRLLPDIESKIIDENGREVGTGEHGVLHVRSASVMNGYYRNPELTAAVLESGWLDTGDIVARARGGELAIIGRAKDTIILLGGENVEPEPIEEHLRRSSLIEDAMIVGQDRRYLSALVVVDPHEAARFLAENGETDRYDEANAVSPSRSGLADSPLLYNRVRQDIAESVSGSAGYRLHEQIYRFTLVPRAFREPDELTHTRKKRRRVIEANFAQTIHSMYT